MVKKEEWIKKSIKKYGDIYDFSKVDYKGSQIKVCLVCPEHGEFWIEPSNFLRERRKIGCPFCTKHCKNINTNLWINKAKEVHGDKYDYSKSIYINNYTPICIICSKHGEFWQTPNKHSSAKHICPFCGEIQRIESKILTQEEWINKAKEVHGDKYDYSKSIYINSRTKIKIICPIHGEFEQIANSHLQGIGCNNCSSSKLEKEFLEILKQNDIKYETQKTFNWLINSKTNRKLMLDFYLPDYNVAIECQGLQHFKPIFIFGNEKGFEKTVGRDIIKKNKCMENNLKLYYYSNLMIDYPYEVYENSNELIKKIKYDN